MPVKSIKVKDYMSGKLVTFKPDTDILDAIHELVNRQIAGAPVVDGEGGLTGVISQTDLVYYNLTRSDELVLDSNF